MVDHHRRIAEKFRSRHEKVEERIGQAEETRTLDQIIELRWTPIDRRAEKQKFVFGRSIGGNLRGVSIVDVHGQGGFRSKLFLLFAFIVGFHFGQSIRHFAIIATISIQQIDQIIADDPNDQTNFHQNRFAFADLFRTLSRLDVGRRLKNWTRRHFARRDRWKWRCNEFFRWRLRKRRSRWFYDSSGKIDLPSSGVSTHFHWIRLQRRPDLSPLKLEESKPKRSINRGKRETWPSNLFLSDGRFVLLSLVFFFIRFVVEHVIIARTNR